MRNLRRHLGPGYTEDPAKRIGEYLGDKIFKVIMWIVCCILWAGAYYIVISVVNFNRATFQEGAKEMTNAELYMTPGALTVYGAGCLVLLFIVHRARRGEKRIDRNRVQPQDRAAKRPTK